MDPMALQQPTPCLDTEDACADFLFRLKWPAGFTCPTCYFKHAYRISTRRLPLYECSWCGKQTSLTAGTVMENSRTPLTKWFKSILLISDPNHGISATALQRIIRVTYKTAWTMLHKIRLAMGKSEWTHPLSGEVILNDSCYGRPHNPTVFLHPQETPVLIGASISKGEPVRIMVRLVPPTELEGNQITRYGTEQFIQKYVASDATITDVQVKKYSPRKLKKTLPLFRIATRWINTTFHGLGKKHLQTYFSEFCSRTNLYLTAAPVFENISRICSIIRAVPYAKIIQRTLYS